MAVFRVNKTDNYVVMSNHHLKEKKMSLKSKGLLSQMLSLSNDWDYSIRGLIAINKEQETSIKSALNELKEFGYLKITKLMPNETKSGRIEYIYDIYEKPYKKQGIGNLSIENQVQQYEKQDIENLYVENQVQYNINNKVLNNNNNNKKKKEPIELFDYDWINEE